MNEQMLKLYTPDYYKAFKCKAGKCTDTCCTAWEIDIDDNTYKLYKTKAEELEKSGSDPDFAKKLKACIVEDEAIHFDLSGRTYCPFFTEDGLCEIQLKMGEEALCQICNDHPRYYEYFPDRKEAGVGLCCEAACELIMFNEEPVSFVEEYFPAKDLLGDDFEASDSVLEDEEYRKKEESFNALNDFLFDARASLLEILQNRNLNLSHRVSLMIKDAEYIQDMMEDALLFGEELRNPYEILDEIEASEDECSYDLDEIKALLKDHSKAIPLKNEWHELILKLDDDIAKLIELEASFREKYKDADLRYEQLLSYFIFRYACKALYDGDFYTKVKFAIDSICLIHLIEVYAYSKNVELNRENLIRIASAYSKEIEYSEENMNMFMY
ncbi:MAG: flagellin lysine-N-methylase [Eubacteriales bacterium]|nr:flagellin lysine-N-methylase [Eubacteriales bacterium]